MFCNDGMTGSKDLNALQETWRHATMQMAFREIRRCLTDLLSSSVINAHSTQSYEQFCNILDS